MKVFFLFLFLPFLAVSQSHTFRNPILPGAHPDPSICKAGDTYYIVNSSFEYFPGLPIHKSTDLVNWDLVGYGLHRKEQCTGVNNLVDVQGNGGIHAPTIRFNDGTFYIITTNVYSPVDPESRTQFINFIITAEDPAGPWSDPHIIEGAPGIDPDLFFDDDGKTYYIGTHDEGDMNRSGIGEIWVQELDLVEWKLTGPRTTIWGGACGGCCVEGPHMYKREGNYYIMVSEGGTSFNHAMMIAASDNIRGPFDSNPANPILTSRHLSKDNWVHSTGHADFVQIGDERWYMVALGIRGDEDRGSNMGRETYLIPMTWEPQTVRWQEVTEGNWEPVEYLFPICAPETGKVEQINPLPFDQQVQYRNDAFADNFDTQVLGLEWNFRRVPRAETYSLSENPGFLRLNAQPSTFAPRERYSVVGFRQRESDFEYQVRMKFSSKKTNEEAGISIFQKDDNYLNFTIKKVKTDYVLNVYYAQKESGRQTVKESKVSGYKGDIIFRVISKNHQYFYEYSLDDGTNFQPFTESAADLVLNQGYTGAYLGLFASSNGSKTKAYADFDWIKYMGYPRY